MVIDRRTALKAGTAALVIGQASIASAHDSKIPELDETLDFLQSPRAIALLYNQFALAFHVAIIIAAKLEGATLENPEALDRFPLLPSELNESNDLFNLLTFLSGNEGAGQLAKIQDKLKENGDPIEIFKDEHLRLVSSFKKYVAEFGADPNGSLADPAVDSLTHVERIAAVEITKDAGSSYLCRIFPFKGSWFCN